MPRLDIDELLEDEDLAGNYFQVIRTVQTVNTDGIAVPKVPPITFPCVTGGVYPSSDKELALLSDEMRIGDFITVVTAFRLVPLTRSLSPDQVVWENSNYRVMQVKDFSNYGRGMIVAICQLMPFVLNDSVASPSCNE